jgi:hypothetical protein
MDESREGPVPFLRRTRPQYEPVLNEEERFPTLLYNSEPIPPWVELVPPGMIGYHDMKKEQMAEAKRDRNEPELVSREDQQDAKRWALITRLAIRFPQLNVPTIAEGVVPWDVEEFKRLVAERQTQYLKEMTT